MSTHRLIARSAGTIGSFTALSRILGFIRDLVIASVFGTGIQAEAFVVSFKIPNLFRDLVGEGATNSTFVPVLTECQEKQREAYWGLVSTLFYILTGILALLTLAGIFWTEEIVRLLAPGFVNSPDAEKFPLAVRLTRVIFPYLFLIGLSALAMGVLHSKKEFTSSAMGPALLNITMILAGVFLAGSAGPMALVLAVLCGGVLQLSCQVPALLRQGFRLTRPRFSHPLVKQIGRLLLPRVFGSALYQLNVLVDSVLASFDRIVGLGGQSALYYSNRLFQLPLAIFGVSLAQALLPTFSTQMVRRDLPGFKETLTTAIHWIGAIVIPASVGLVVLAEPIIRTLFQRGRFDHYSTMITADALFFYAFGLFSCCLIKILVNAFYAMQDTKTPVKTMLFSVAINIVLSLILMRPLKIGGLALASSLSATANTCFLYFVLRKRLGGFNDRAIFGNCLRVFLASVGMGGFAFWYRTLFLESAGVPAAAAVFRLGGGIALSLGVYGGLAFLLKVQPLRNLWGRT